MGRGRQKAKQTKVARALKYYSPQTDYERLQRELRGESGNAHEGAEPYEQDFEYEDDDYSRWNDEDEDDQS